MVRPFQAVGPACPGTAGSGLSPARPRSAAASAAEPARRVWASISTAHPLAAAVQIRTPLGVRVLPAGPSHLRPFCCRRTLNRDAAVWPPPDRGFGALRAFCAAEPFAFW